MFSAYFTGSYFPTAWGGASEPATPGGMAATVLGLASASAPLLGRAALGMASGGAGSLTGDLSASSGPSVVDMACEIHGAGSLAGALYEPPAAGGGGGIQPTGRTRRRFVTLACEIQGAGRLWGRCETALRVVQEVHGFSLPTFEATRAQVAAPPPAPVAVFKPAPPPVYVPLGMVAMGSSRVVAGLSAIAGASALAAGNGSLTGALTVSARPAPDHRALAVALLMLMEDAA